MIIYLSSIPILITLSLLYGSSMKMADLFNEHGVREWFKGAIIMMGILWGLFGALLIISNIYVANLVMAMVLAFIVRMRIDYWNHAIATVIIIITFLFTQTIEPTSFITFFLVFSIFGAMKDYFGDKVRDHSFVHIISELAWYYVIPTLIYSYVTGIWEVFIVGTVYIIAYNLVKYYMEEDFKKLFRKY
ncbi:MAG: hypothetical protein JWN37_856 [Candidatus Nomurabacteria bacterium]|nr:hypothetical protein [Candidatus Nomurabacteria bacterium]